MKNLILIIGTLLIALNTLIGLILSDYAILNFLLVDLSIALSVGIIYLMACSEKMVDGYKIGLTILLFFTGIARCLFIAFAEQVLANNYCFIVAIGILLFELVCVATALFASKKQTIIKQQTE